MDRQKTHEYRPRLRVSRKKPVTRKGTVVVAVFEEEADAIAIETSLLEIILAIKLQKKQVGPFAPGQPHSEDGFLPESARAVDLSRAPAEAGGVEDAQFSEVSDGTTSPSES